MAFLEAGNNRLYYQVEARGKGAGAGSVPGVLFLHSLGADHRLWRYQLEGLRDQAKCLVATDLRGHGRSTYNGGISLDLAAEDILALIDALGVRKVSLCGVSLGGVEALVFAQRYPERVSGLVLSNTFARLDPDVAAEKIRLTAGIATEQGMERYADTYLDSTLSPSRTAQAIREDVRRAIAAMELGAYREWAQACFEADVEAGLGTIRAPTLVLSGDNDQKVPLQYSQLIADRIPQARLRTVPNAAHLSNVDNPEVFNRLVAELLEQAAAESGG
jgi:pimeloyl-ACP methyl ester carboxylesterase